MPLATACELQPRAEQAAAAARMLYTFTRPISAENRNLLLRCNQIETRPARSDVHFFRMKIAALPAISQHHRTALPAEFGQFHAIFIVEICDRNSRRIGAAAFE